MTDKIPGLGAQDPELRNSPIAWESDEDADALRELGPGEPLCYFNDAAYEHGTVVKVGSVLLRCSYGLWLPLASADPDNP